MTKVRPLLPAALVPALFIAVVATPVEVLGCRNRGLLAVAIIFIGLVSALFIGIRGLSRRAHGQKAAADQIAALLLLTLPAIYLVLSEF